MALIDSHAEQFFYVLQDSAKILFVDDDPILREFASVNLTSDHATVTTAGDGLDALDQLDLSAPDLMLLDLEMPRMDGFEVLDRLRASDRWAPLPVIVVTGREDVTAVDRAYRCGATSFVIKPINWRLLSYQIRYVLRSSRGEASGLRAQAQSAAQLECLAAESSRFLAAALKRDPSLRTAAHTLAGQAECVLRRTEPRAS